jgi:hypothetical protein
MAYLNGNAVPDLLTFRTLFAKWIGTMCACTANLTLGLEAPMVHLGACVAHCITHATCCKGPCRKDGQRGSVRTNRRSRMHTLQGKSEKGREVKKRGQ